LPTINTELDIANQIIIQRFVRHYLSGQDREFWTIEGACVTPRQIGSRYGIPRDALTWSYLFEHPDLAWSFRVRSVWRNGDLMQPWATHTIIEAYFDDEDRYGGPNGARQAVNEWLLALDL
jgi:hypothetical protein